MTDTWSMVLYTLIGFSPLVTGLLAFFAIAYIGHRHDQRIVVERKRLAFSKHYRNAGVTGTLPRSVRSQSKTTALPK